MNPERIASIRNQINSIEESYFLAERANQEARHTALRQLIEQMVKPTEVTQEG